MPSITTITDADSWFIREIPGSAKFNAQVTAKINTLVDNQVIINNYLDQLLQGAAAGAAQQAVIFMPKNAAPTGWTRDTSFTTDHLLRVTDTSSVPAGASPTATGGDEGGNWSITGIANATEAAHTHVTAAHGHTASSGTESADHAHFTSGGTGGQNASHSHATPVGMGIGGVVTARSDAGSPLWPNGTYVGNFQYYGVGCSTGSGAYNYLFTGQATADHAHGWGAWSGGRNTAHSHAISVVNSADLTSNAGSAHTHVISQDAGWRPKYLNIIPIKKD